MQQASLTWCISASIVTPIAVRADGMIWNRPKFSIHCIPNLFLKCFKARAAFSAGTEDDLLHVRKRASPALI